MSKLAYVIKDTDCISKQQGSATSAHVMDQSALNSEAYQHLVLKRKLRLQGWGMGLVGIGPSRLGQESPSLCPHAPQLKKSPFMMTFLVVLSVCSQTQFYQGKNNWIQELSKTTGFATDTEKDDVKGVFELSIKDGSISTFSHLPSSHFCKRLMEGKLRHIILKWRLGVLWFWLYLCGSFC